MYSSGVTFLNPIFPNTFPLLSKITTNGKLPSILYFSANFLLCSVCSFDNSFAFFLGKFALTKTHSSFASFLNASDCQIFLSNLMHGAHQSEPEKTMIMFLSCSDAIFFASSKFSCHSCANPKFDTKTINPSVRVVLSFPLTKALRGQLFHYNSKIIKGYFYMKIRHNYNC